MIEQTIEITTRDGSAATFIVHPERDGPHPLVLLLMDAYGIREDLRDMARRFAAAGYYVMLPNLYYRAGVCELPELPTLPVEELHGRLGPLIGGLTLPMVCDDADALMYFADRDPAASPGAAGVVGYCMSGQYAMCIAGRHPERIRAAASIYGVQLMTDMADSPHRGAAKSGAELYFAFAEHDPWVPLETVAALDQAMKDRSPPAEVEIYPGADHGFAFIERPAYHKPSAERHWERLYSLFERRLR